MLGKVWHADGIDRGRVAIVPYARRSCCNGNHAGTVAAGCRLHYQRRHGVDRCERFPGRRNGADPALGELNVSGRQSAKDSSEQKTMASLTIAPRDPAQGSSVMPLDGGFAVMQGAFYCSFIATMSMS